MKAQMFKVTLTILYLLLLMVGCTASRPTSLIPTGTKNSSSPTLTASPLPLINNFTATVAVTPSLTTALTSTKDIEDSFDPKREPSEPTSKPQPPTWTPLPTLPLDEVQAYVLDLLQNNAGCRLPCWWGITPGKTTWQEAKSFLETFTRLTGVRDRSDELSYAYFRIPFPEDMGSISHTYVIRKGVVDEISNIYYGNLTAVYNLIQVLNAYGQPDEVLMSAYYEARYSDYMVVVAVFYLQQGILVKYFDNDVVTIGNKVQVCPQKATFPYLSLWSPTHNITIQEATDRYLDTKNWPAYRSLQEATGMDVETFYRTFKDPNSTTCLETPTVLWLRQ